LNLSSAVVRLEVVNFRDPYRDYCVQLSELYTITETAKWILESGLDCGLTCINFSVKIKLLRLKSYSQFQVCSLLLGDLPQLG
jgi:hypothetical protein